MEAVRESPVMATNVLDGDLADTRVYARALSENEMLTIANCAGHDGIVQNLQARYLYDEKEEGFNHPNPTTLDAFLDSSGNEFHGDSVNDVTYIGAPISHRKKVT